MLNSLTKNYVTGIQSINANLEVDLESISHQVQGPAQAWACHRWEVKKKAWHHQTGRYQALVGFEMTGCSYISIRELKQITTETATRTPPNKRFNE